MTSLSSPPTQPPADRPAAVIVLAAGAGTRMRSRLPKVLHRIGGRTLVGHVVHAARGLDPERLAVVVRHERELVAEHLSVIEPDAMIVDQDEIPGTGRAVQCALEALDARGPLEGPVVVVAGDTPLLDAGTLAGLLAQHAAERNAVTVLTARVADPAGYGRILRDADGAIIGVVEQKDATEEQRAIDEVNTSTYVFDAGVLRDALARVGTDNAQGEVYLTDVVAGSHARGLGVRGFLVPDSRLVEGANDRVQLAALGAELNRRVLERHMRAGVTIVDPATTWIDVTVDVGQDTTLLPGTQLLGATSIARDAVVGPHSTLTDTEVGRGAEVVQTYAELAVIGEGADVGPFARLRTGAVVPPHKAVPSFTDLRVDSIDALEGGTAGTDTSDENIENIGDVR